MEKRQTGFGTYVQLSGMMFLQFAIWGGMGSAHCGAHAKSRVLRQTD